MTYNRRPTSSRRCLRDVYGHDWGGRRIRPRLYRYTCVPRTESLGSPVYRSADSDSRAATNQAPPGLPPPTFLFVPASLRIQLPALHLDLTRFCLLALG